MTGKTESPSDKTNVQACPPPPSYTTLFPTPADAALNDSPQASASASQPRQPTPASAQELETINTLRDANPRLALDPPLPQSTRFKTAEAAARTAMVGVNRAFAKYRNEKHSGVMAAHTAHAISLAVSTSRSYIAFVAATTAAESAALLIEEAVRQKIPLARQRERGENALWSAVECALAAEASNTTNGTWPSSTHDTDAM